ncbi:spermidine synthase-like isoform X1 [Pomacea canaliculata]|uniref:spermidine synthase-like isoform X1 n=1 Tax=Pomacea canaliculata TaxID=400727 RepID=UPI000D739EB5|nr:spermidine synthase-like isoform X1 [Pomacea canaliculata]
MDKIKNGWFSEVSELWPGQSMCLEVQEALYNERSKYQDILVFKSKTYGNVLVLDGVIQCTERDEFSYQEMIVHLPLCCHPNPRKVLIIGGGDGGVAREVLKHKTIECIDMCEIDEKVIEVSKKYLPQMASSFNDPRLKLHIQDGFEFIANRESSYDIIITDSSDPVGPASSLFEKQYYELMKKALKPDGILCSQGECTWLHLDLIRSMQEFCRTLFPSVSYAYTTIPTYPSGQIGFVLCSLNPDLRFEEPVRTLTSQQVDEWQLKYYNSKIHRAAFCLPEFARKAIQESKPNGDTM